MSAGAIRDYVSFLMPLILIQFGLMAVALSSHILNDVERVCDIVGILKEGRLIAQKPIHELRASFAARCLYVAMAFLRKESHEILRTYKIYVIPAIFLLMGFFSPLVAEFTPEIVKSMAPKMRKASPLLFHRPRPSMPMHSF